MESETGVDFTFLALDFFALVSGAEGSAEVAGTSGSSSMTNSRPKTLERLAIASSLKFPALKFALISSAIDESSGSTTAFGLRTRLAALTIAVVNSIGEIGATMVVTVSAFMIIRCM